MSLGQVYSTLTTLPASGTLSIQPEAGKEAVIHNIYYSGSIEVYFTNGTLQVKIHSDDSYGDLQGYWHVTSDRYLQIVDKTGSGNTVGFDGVYTKV